MGFPIPGNAIEQSLDLNQRLGSGIASTFVMQVDPATSCCGEVYPGDLLIVDRARTPKARSLVVAIVDNELAVTRFDVDKAPAEIWGVVSALIRENP